MWRKTLSFFRKGIGRTHSLFWERKLSPFFFFGEGGNYRLFSEQAATKAINAIAFSKRAKRAGLANQIVQHMFEDPNLRHALRLLQITYAWKHLVARF